MSLVGYGNKRFGSFRTGENIVQLVTIFKKYNILFQNEAGALLKEDDLTPGRLCRLFRYQIRDFIRKTNQPAYLWRKYSDRNPKFKDICFRGSEYIDELTIEEMNYLIQTTKNLDNKRGTLISERLIRVFEAKGHNI